MKTDGSGSLQEDGAAALRLIEEALALLDRCDAPGEIGAQLDHAMQRLKTLIAPQPFPQQEAPRPPRHP